MPLYSEEVLVIKDRLPWPSPLVTSFFLPHDSLRVGERGFGQVVTQLYQLTRPRYQHTIGTFNTSSRRPTHWSLIDTDEGYNLEGAGFPHHTFRPSQPMVLHFPPKGLTQSQVIQHQHKPIVRCDMRPIISLWSFDHLASIEVDIYV
jgi:hypothetical protein